MKQNYENTWKHRQSPLSIFNNIIRKQIYVGRHICVYNNIHNLKIVLGVRTKVTWSIRTLS